MRWKDRYRFVRQNMAKTKSRVFMTILAAAMGCAFLMTLASVAFGLQNSLVRDVTGGRLLTDITIYNRTVGDESRALTPADVKLLRSADHVKAVTVRTVLPQSHLSLDGYGVDTNPLLVDFADEGKSALSLSQGRLPADAAEAVVGYHFAKALADDSGNPYTGPLLGRQLAVAVPEERQAEGDDGKAAPTVHTVTVTIVGILAKPDREYRQDGSLLLADTLYPALLPETAKLSPAPEPNDVHAFADNASHLTKISKLYRSQGFALYSPADSLKQLDALFLVMKAGLIFVGTIAVLIASIGIYNTMTMAVTERAQDIGIMKAIGAHPRVIRSIFLLESAGIGIAGVFIGAAVSYAISAGVNIVLPPLLNGVLDTAMPDNFRFSSIPPALTFISAAISLAIAVLSGVRPAARATKIDVLSALRRDI